jgi:hypothetical protein
MYLVLGSFVGSNVWVGSPHHVPRHGHNPCLLHVGGAQAFKASGAHRCWVLLTPSSPPHLVGKAAPLQDACTATSSVIVFHFRSSSSASTTFLHLPAPRSVMPDRGSKWVGWVAHLVEASRLVLGWICEGLCRTMLQVIIDSPLQVVYAFYRSSTTPLSPLPTGSALVL